MRLRIFVLALLAFPALSAAQQHAPPARFWQPSYAKAEAEAQRLELPLLVHFSAAWCRPCRQMEAQVLDRPELQRSLGNAVVAVRVDVDAHPEISRKFNVGSIPCDIILSPKGTIIARNEGFQDLASYQAFGRKGVAYVAAQKKAPSRQLAGQGLNAPNPKPRNPAPAVADTVPPGVKSTPASNPNIRLAPPEPTIGMDGYCPVRLWVMRTWVKGNPEFTSAYQGITFQFAGPLEMQDFQADPGRFIPQLLGCDPVVLWDTDRAIPGTTRFAAFYDGELFLFETSESRRRFRMDPPRFTRTRHVLRPDQIERNPIRTSRTTPAEPR